MAIEAVSSHSSMVRQSLALNMAGGDFQADSHVVVVVAVIECYGRRIASLIQAVVVVSGESTLRHAPAGRRASSDSGAAIQVKALIWRKVLRRQKGCSTFFFYFLALP